MTEGIYYVYDEPFMVVSDEFFSDLYDMGYGSGIELEDLIIEYYDWLEEVTE